MMSRHRIYVGTSGWHYKHWIGKFYPETLPASEHFSHYQKHFNAVELNNPFYRLPSKDTFAAWKQSVSADFKFSVKASRFITHMKKLRDPAQSIAKFMENVAALGGKLAVILFQLPPNWNINSDRLADFLENLPKGFRYVFEFRNHTWFDDKIYTLLKKYNCAFCIYDLERHLSPIEVTAGFVYVRLHGPDAKYDGSYSDAVLEQWAARCSEWAKNKDVFVFFDNDIGNAPFDALRLKELLEIKS